MTKRIWCFWGVLLSTFMIGVFAERSVADMYQWVDKNGMVHFSDAPHAGAVNSNVDSRGGSLGTANPFQAKAGKKKPKVELYTTSWRPWCEKAKAYFRSRGNCLCRIQY